MHRRIWSGLSLVVSAGLLVMSCMGCGESIETSVSPDGAAAALLESLDANHDGSLDQEELKKCPPLTASGSSTLDTNRDGQLSGDEVRANFQRMFASKNLLEASCTVRLGNAPLEGAKVTLRPIDSLKDSLPSAEATTDASGVARPTIPKDELPSEYQSMNLLYPGLYHVEIEHPQKTLPSRYNTESELGWAIDPTSRTGTEARFDLNPN
jgi:hypothetical protein